MIFYYTFPALVLANAVIAISWCYRRGRNFFLWWILPSIVLGLGGLFVPWHTSSEMHRGSGSPIPVVVWERIASDVYIDFPVPVAVVLDPICVYFIGAVAWLVFHAIRKRAPHIG